MGTRWLNQVEKCVFMGDDRVFALSVSSKEINVRNAPYMCLNEIRSGNIGTWGTSQREMPDYGR